VYNYTVTVSVYNYTVTVSVYNYTVTVSVYNYTVTVSVYNYTVFITVILHSGDLVHSIGDAHVYKNHVTPLQEQLLREPRPFPTLKIKRQVTDINSFTFQDLELLDYKPHPKIAMEMSV